MGDILVLTAPIVQSNNVKYYLYNPRGDFSKLDIKTKKHTPNETNYGVLSIKNIRKKAPIVKSMRTYKLFNMYNVVVSDDKDEINVFNRNQLLMGPDEFMLGPLGEDDFGNWVMSAYYKDDTGEWTEIFQSFALMIVGKLKQVTMLKITYVGSHAEIGLAPCYRILTNKIYFIENSNVLNSNL